MRTLLIPLSVVVALPLQAAGLPDTGQNFCYDGTTVVACNDASSGDGSAYPRQDGRFGRDAAAALGRLSKTGAGQNGFDYSRICNSGEVAGTGTCPAVPSLGPHNDDWGCTRDNVTGLTWEVKVAGIDLRSSVWTYSWYGTFTGNGGVDGLADGTMNCGLTGRCDTAKYVEDVNIAGLCGASDWRLPSQRELESIVHLGAFNPVVDWGYFPNTETGKYWSVSTYAGDPLQAWAVDFLSGLKDGLPKNDPAYVRLVRGAPF